MNEVFVHKFAGVLGIEGEDLVEALKSRGLTLVAEPPDLPANGASKDWMVGYMDQGHGHGHFALCTLDGIPVEASEENVSLQAAAPRLVEAVTGVAMALGITHGDMALTGPQLLLLAANAKETIERFKAGAEAQGIRSAYHHLQARAKRVSDDAMDAEGTEQRRRLEIVAAELRLASELILDKMPEGFTA